MDSRIVWNNIEASVGVNPELAYEPALDADNNPELEVQAREGGYLGGFEAARESAWRAIENA